MLPLGTAAPDFKLPDTNGKTVSLSDFRGKPVLVMFICNHCPFVKHIRAELAKLGRDYQPRGLAIVAISSNDAANYPDDELAVIMRGLVEATGRPPAELVEDFGVAIVPGLLEIYGFLVNPRWSFMDFLLNTEDVIHRGVKLNTPNARPPELQATRNGPDSGTISYRSKRGLCPLAKGIIRGAATRYHVDIEISEARCMLRGDPECLITVLGQE